MNTKSKSRFQENQACLKTTENDNRCYGNLCCYETGKKSNFGHMQSSRCSLAKIEDWLPK